MHAFNKSKRDRRSSGKFCVFHSRQPSDILLFQRQKGCCPLVYRCSAVVLKFMEIHICLWVYNTQVCALYFLLVTFLHFCSVGMKVKYSE